MRSVSKPGSGARNPTAADQRRRVLQIAKELSATLGADFFHSVVRHLAAAFHADCVCLGQLYGSPPDRFRTLAVFRSSGDTEGFEQKLSGAAAAYVIANGGFVCGRDAGRLFPLDEVIAAMEAEAYVGLRLSDSAGQPIGLLTLISGAQLADPQLVKSVVETFVPRAAAELERKRSDDIHRENEERYRAFVATNPDAMWRVEFEQPVPLSLTEEEQVDRIYRFGYVAECNDAAARLAGRESAPDLVGVRFDTIAPREDAQLQDELLDAIRSGFRLSTVEARRLDDGDRQLYRLRSQLGMVYRGELHRIWFTARDITPLRRAELSLAASEARFRAVLESIQLPAVMLDPNGALTFANECFLRLAQRAPEDAAGLAWLEGTIPPGERELWEAALTSGSDSRYPGVHFEGTILPPGGQPLTIAWDMIGFRGRDGDPGGLAAIGRDVTRQRALEMEILQAQKLESVGRLAAGVAHDFNNLLTVVLGRAGQLLCHAGEGTREHEYLSEIEHAATQCSKLTGELLAFSRKQQLRPRLINLNDVLTEDEGIIRTLAGGRIKVVLELASPLGAVFADPIQIRRVIANLVTNARDAMPEGGQLTIAASHVVIGANDLTNTAVPPGVYVRLSVTDTGPGVTDEVRAHLFEPFFTTKPLGKGTGLGLSTVYGIVTQSGGHIEVHSAPGDGTTFEIIFPAASMPPGAGRPA